MVQYPRAKDRLNGFCVRANSTTTRWAAASIRITTGKEAGEFQTGGVQESLGEICIHYHGLLSRAIEQVTDRFPECEAFLAFVPGQLVNCARFTQPSQVRINLPPR